MSMQLESAINHQQHSSKNQFTKEIFIERTAIIIRSKGFKLKTVMFEISSKIVEKDELLCLVIRDVVKMERRGWRRHLESNF